MSLLHAALLGLIQGLTEFLPISSTAHLTIAGRALGLVNGAAPEVWTAQIAVMQLGTLVAVLAYFRGDLFAIAAAFLAENVGSSRRPYAAQSPDARMGWYVIVGTLPVVVAGLALKHIIESALTKNLIVIGSSLILLALLLELAERLARHARGITETTLRDALIVGCAQCFALIPGASRSGTTITGGLFAGLNRAAAARFSFLLSIPAVAAGGLLELVQTWKAGHFAHGEAAPLAVATLTALISGYASIAFLLGYLRAHSTRIFIVYRLALGALLLGGVYAGWFAA